MDWSKQILQSLRKTLPKIGRCDAPPFPLSRYRHSNYHDNNQHRQKRGAKTMFVRLELNQINLFLETAKSETLDFNFVETDGPFTSEEITQGMSRDDYVTHMMIKGNNEGISEAYFDELSELNEILVLTVSNKLHPSNSLLSHRALPYGSQRLSIKTVHVLLGNCCFSDAYSIKNCFEKQSWFSLSQLQNAFRVFGMTITAAIRQTNNEETEDMICMIVRKG